MLHNGFVLRFHFRLTFSTRYIVLRRAQTRCACFKPTLRSTGDLRLWGPSSALDSLLDRSQRPYCALLTLLYFLGRSGSATVIAGRCDRAITQQHK